MAIASSPRGPVTARTVAAEVLLRVERDAAFASAALEAALSRASQLDARDRALATELAYGALRTRGFLIERIGRFARHGVDAIEPHVRAILLVAAYQLFFLSRVPAFAAVNDAVDAARALRGAKVAGFVNAVLRRLAADAARAPVDRDAAILASTPAWLRDAIVRAVGEEELAALVGGDTAPPVVIRVQDARDRDTWIERLRAAAPEAEIEPGRASPLAVRLRGAGRPADLPGFAEGSWALQEEGSQIVGLALGARPGERVLDACAGRGNKTAVLARAVEPAGSVDAADLHPSKLDRLARELARQGLAPRAVHPVDWTIGAGEVPDDFDAVLVDAPCSGTGTLRRRPDLLGRRAPEDLAALAGMQLAIVRRAATRLRPGGRLVYAVCSVLREEAEEVVERLLAADPSLTLAPFAAPELRALAGDAPFLRLLPGRHGTDGYFLASLRKDPIASPGGAA